MLSSLYSRLVRAFLALGILGAAEVKRQTVSEEDPNSRFLCQGSLSDFAACQCREEDSELSCINAQFVDTDVFLHVNNHYRHLRKVTFHGNNFQDLPDSPLFGPNVHQNLEVLNISANYIVNLHSHALQGMPNLLVLDISNNEIVLKDEDVNFLSHTPKLKQLYLRRAFTSLVNRTLQFTLMMRMFRNAKLNELNYIDLSYNYLTSVPYDIACPFPTLRYVDLRQNFLQTLNVNTSCMSHIQTLDLSRNHFRQLDETFRSGVGSRLPPNSIMLRNSFHCNCESAEYIKWIRKANTIRDRTILTCQRASPPEFVGARLIDVPLNKLDCAVSLISNSASRNVILPIVVFLYGRIMTQISALCNL
uniref:Trophoblast glycoprotein n=1 Tax=Parascaris univalens TaxID=6257 RepID=A0A915AJC5_PARUN